MPNPFSALLNPDKEGTLTGFLGGVMGNPTGSQYQGNATGVALQKLNEMISQGQPPQQAIVNFLKSPEGIDYFTAAGPQGFDQLQKSLSAATPPDPKAVGLRPGETGVISQGGKLLTGPNAVSVPTTEVQNFNTFSGIAKLPQDKVRELAEMQIDPTAKNTTQKERAIDNLVTSYGLDQATGEKLKAGLIQVQPLKDNFNNDTGNVVLIDMSDPQNVKSVLIKPGQTTQAVSSTKGAGAPASPPQAGGGPGVTPAQGAGTGVLPPAKPDPTANKAYYGDKSSMFLGAGVVPNVLGAASKLTEQLDPSLIIPEGAKANDRATLIAQTKNAISAMGADGSSWGVNKNTLKTFQDLVPNDSLSSSPHAEIQKGIRLRQLIESNVKNEENTIASNDPNVSREGKLDAAKRIQGWNRVLDTLPTMDEMAKMEESIRNGTAGAATVSSGVKTLMNAGGKALTAGKKQAGEIQNDVNGQDFSSMNVQQLRSVDTGKLSVPELIKYKARIQQLKAQNGSKSGSTPQ